MAAELYFDWNSTTPPADEVVAAMYQAQAAHWGNPSSVHGVGRFARAALEETREALAQSFDVHPRDVLFTSGGTEANNLALAGAATLLTSRLEHPSVVRVAEQISSRGGQVLWLPVTGEGQHAAPDLALALEQLGTAAQGALVTLNAANHETGVLEPVAELIEVAHRFGARVHVDAVQWLGKRELRALRGADSIAVAAHKIRGPKGVGALLFRGPPPRPVLLGGAQERGLRPGTLDAVAAVGFRVALMRAGAGPERTARLGPLRDKLEAALSAVTKVNGGGAERMPHVSNLSFTGMPGPELVAALDLAGFCVSSGSACSAGTSEPSPVIAHMLGSERAASAVRFSFGESTDEMAIDRLIDMLFQILKRK
jgi:cysteine desulfurase